MTMRSTTLLLNLLTLSLAVGASGCQQSAEPGGNGGANTGGSTNTSRAGGSAGSSSTGGTAGATTATGGSSGTGGSTGTGGGSGGIQATGGSSGTGGGAGAGSGGGPGTGGSDGGAMETGGSDTGTGAETGGGGDGKFTLLGPDFLMISNNRLCHKKEQTSSGTQTSPGLNWTGLPAGTMSIAVSLKDRDAGTHWVMWDIPPTETGIPKDINKAMKPAGSKTTGNWYGPGAGPHTYEYRVWAIKTPTLPGGCGGKACYPGALMTNSIAFAELIVLGAANGTCPQ